MAKLLKCLAWVVSGFYLLCVMVALFAIPAQDVVWFARLPAVLAAMVVALILFSVLFSIRKILELLQQCRATQLETEALLLEVHAALCSSSAASSLGTTKAEPNGKE